MLTHHMQNELAALAKSNAASLGHQEHAARTAALEAAKQAINGLCDREAETQRKAAVELQASRAAQLQAADAAVEAARRDRAARLLGELRAPAADSLATLVASFRAQPTRGLAIAIRTTWDRFNQRALAELGEALSTSVAGAIIVDDIVAQPGLAGAINYLSDHQFGCGDRVLAALHRALVGPVVPKIVEDALVECETLLLERAGRHAGTTPDPAHLREHAIKLSHATYRDQVHARAEFEAAEGARHLAHHAATYTPPPTLADRFKRQLADRGLLPGGAAE